MVLELTKATFRRLVMLELLLTLVAVPALAWYQLDPEWIAFDTGFEALIVGIGGRVAASETQLVFSGIVLLSTIISLIGLLSFRLWARTLYLVSWVCILVLYFIWYAPANYSTVAEDLVETLDNVIGGAILTMVYGRGLGTEWFAVTHSNPS